MAILPSEFPKHTDLSEIGRYLETHLIEILKHGAGGKHPPCLWIYRRKTDPPSLVHAFGESNSNGDMVFGNIKIPNGCLIDKKIFLPKRSEMESFLIAFKLGVNEVKLIIDLHI